MRGFDSKHEVISLNLTAMMSSLEELTAPYLFNFRLRCFLVFYKYLLLKTNLFKAWPSIKCEYFFFFIYIINVSISYNED